MNNLIEMNDWNGCGEEEGGFIYWGVFYDFSAVGR